VAGEQLYAVDSGGVVKRVSATNDSRTMSALPRPIDHGKYPVNALAVSVTNTDLAATTNDRTTLIRAPIATGKASALLSGKTELLRPQFTRYGEIWDIGREGGRQRVWMFTADNNKAVAIDSPMLHNVKAFRISPDGTRMALVRTTKAGSELGLARIIRSDKIMVDGWRPVDTTQTSAPPIGRIADVAWLDATEMLVLGSADATTAYAPFRVVEDASQITPKGESESWNAVELAVLPRTQAAIVVGQDGRTWKDDGNQWQPFIDKIRTIAYPG
jgi:hypothetical protein